ncbi:PLP-dependent aminotransferase family protein [Hyphomicrobium sp.]|uniref:PLP-dependent aminotransferase family protein n=1 Tax=Hyphomicrobium sp. TaxID=82 RepID=UPI002FE4039C
MQLPLKVDAHQKATLQSQIVEQIRLMILDGRLRSGDFLPTTRALSEQVGISRNTTMQAYERLMAEGYIQTRPYVGTFVSAEIPENAFCANVCTCEADAAEIRTAFSGPPLSPRLDALRAHGIVNPNADRLVADFWVGRPAPEAFPLKEWSNLVRRRLTRSGRALAEYRDPAGFIDLRQAIADHLGPTRGLTTDPDQIVIVGGTQDGLNLIARLLLESETPVVLESPCYQGAAYLFLKASGRISCPFRWTRAGSTSRSSRTSSAVSSTSRPPTSIRLASR